MALPVAVGGKVTAADINSVANLPVANFAALPSSGNWLGREVATTDSGLTYRWDGSAWIANSVGLVPIRPTSVAGSGVTLSATTGEVSFSTSATVSVNGCFTSTFRRYRIMVRTTFGSNAFWAMRLRLSGSDASGLAYDWQRDTATSTTAAAAIGAAESQWNGMAISALTNSFVQIELDGPAIAAATWGSATIGETNGTGSMGRVDWSGYHRTATAYDGFSLLASASSGTGTLKVYGYN